MKNSSINSARPRLGGKKGAGSIAVVILIALYAFIQPRLNERLGWDLPGLGSRNSDDVVLADGQDSDSPFTQPSQEADISEFSFNTSQVAESGAPSDASANHHRAVFRSAAGYGCGSSLWIAS